jgi:hypothetical protein
MGGPGGGSFARPASGFGHPHFAAHGFNRRFDGGRFGFHRFGFNHFDRFSRFGFDRFNRFAGNQLFIGGLWCCGSGEWGGFPVSTGASEPVVVGGAPVIINIGADPPSGQAAAGSGGCVTHKLIYDGDGKYVGEKQSSQC